MVSVGLEGVSLHSLRHTNATELLRNGVPIAEVSRRLGHADQNITLSIYSHAVPADSRAAAKVWNDALGDVIQTSKKPAAARSLAESCTETTKLRVFVANKRKKMAGTTGLEPATSDVTGRRSNQLNYVPQHVEHSQGNTRGRRSSNLERANRR